MVSAAQALAIASVPQFRNSAEKGASPAELINHYAAWYVDPILTYEPAAAHSSVLDAGTGYGWLAFAFALRTPYRITAVDQDERRLKATRGIAEILGLADQIEFVAGSVGRLPFEDRSFDLTFCVEVLEHVRTSRMAVAYDLARVTRNLLTVTTPNRLFPVISHDTGLPFCHMLPIAARDRYAAWFGRQRRQESNLFWSARELRACFPDFVRRSRFLQFPDYNAYRKANSAESGQANPLSLPIAARTKSAYYRVAQLAGKYSDVIMPSLASTFERRASTTTVARRIHSASAAAPSHTGAQFN